MITADPELRATRLSQVLELLGGDAPAEDRDLLVAFSRVVFAETPDRIALGLSTEALAARFRDQFGFVVKVMTPPAQLHRGVPGLHLRASNPSEAEWVRRGPADGAASEVTIVETHTPDAPFIFEGLKNYFRQSGLRVASSVHPILSVRRQWERVVWIGGPHEEGAKEVYCHFQIERLDSNERLRRLEHEIHSILKCIFASVEDFDDMIRAVRETGGRLASRRGERAEVVSAAAFLDWRLDNNYILIGAARYRFDSDGRPEQVAESALGAFATPALLPVVFPGFQEQVEARLRGASGDDRLIDLDFCNNASAIYHAEPIDDVVIRQWAADGRLAGATVLLGRFALGAFTRHAADIPLLKEKQEWLLAASGAPVKSYAYREVRALFNRFPKRELFYADAESLKKVIDRIVYLTGDDEIAVGSRKGVGYHALYVAFARSRYSYKTEEALRLALSTRFGPISFSTSADCGGVNLLLFYFDSARLDHPVDLETVRRLTESLVTTWEDRVAAELVTAFGDRQGRRLYKLYVTLESRSGLYREATPPQEVPGDIECLERLGAGLELRMIPRSAEQVTLKLYSPRTLALTDTLRMLQNLGLVAIEELRVPLVLPEGRRGTLYRFELAAPAKRIASLHSDRARFSQALLAVDEGRATDDPLNGLVLDAGLSWREVELLRTLRNHLLQIRTHYNAETVNDVLLRNCPVAATLFRHFAAKFDPVFGGDRDAAVAEAEARVGTALEAVQSLAEDEVLRALDDLIAASLRTNFYQRPERPVFSIKVESARVSGMPSPRPWVEIYVHSRLLEGIHLRGGKVARGGIRWSDRHDDFRTEILGLMKTQMVKNSIIVPVGSKGGFVLKGKLPSRPALDQYLVERYREYVSGMLDITDNVVEGKVFHPPDVVRHDGDDPYLVVAADKGTAHLSDTANAVSEHYGFWLGDAFASGGSTGYDHKKVGITARGVWQCVKHHFKNLGVDVQKEPFTAVGIGDLAGDVFGNGALQSRAMKLVACFNHQHIFIDPSPDPERSYRERERMFRLPRSTWRDYDAILISRGGGVFDRSAKAIPLSPEMKSLLDLEGETASGEEVIRHILTARVDLLYNGGIGTYVKAASESDADVGDHANDRVRVDGKQLKARVVAEGGNLGFTQRGRLEYWGRGGLMNTDAIDNSGGVDLSDHEVNLKILMDLLVKKGVLRSRQERNQILAELTEEVAQLVLADNASQALALTLDSDRSRARYEEFVSFIEDLVAAGGADRLDDAVPTREELLSSPERGRGLPRPLLAVLLGHSKRWAYDLVKDSDFPLRGVGRPLLEGYFPRRLRESFGEHFDDHPLKREMVSTVAVNHLVNHAGITFLSRLSTEARKPPAEIIFTYIEADRESGASPLRSEILAAGLSAEAERKALLEIEDRLERLTRRILEGERPDLVAGLEGLRKELTR